MTYFQIGSVLITLAALGSYINKRFLHLPASIGLMVFALTLSSIGISADAFGMIDLTQAGRFIEQLNFSSFLLHGMLSVLLFAGALHIHLDDLQQVKWPVAVLATLGVVLATFINGTLVWCVARALQLPLSYLYSLLFGALISPTDPIAVLAILKRSKVSKQFYAKIGGESLFNDGVAVVVFLTILGLIQHPETINAVSITYDLLREAVGGFAFGVLLGWGVYRLLATIDDYKVEVTVTLAVAMGGYALAEVLHVSAPIAIVVAGLIVGNQARHASMSTVTREYLDVFWELLDEILNAVLFMLIGLEIMVIDLRLQHLALGLGAVIAVLVGRWFSVALPVFVMRTRILFEPGTIRLLTWGGLRGGISIALALSLPHSQEKLILVPVTYVVVLFSILVQGLSFKKLLVAVMNKTKQEV